MSATTMVTTTTTLRKVWTTYLPHLASLTVTERSASPVGPFSNVPFPRDPDYVERPMVSEEIHSRLRPGARLALIGLGGVG